MSALILNTVADWISTLFQHIPKKLRPSLLELLIGTIVAAGHVTDALLAIDFFKHWTSYYKIIEYSRFSALSLTIGWFLLTWSLGHLIPILVLSGPSMIPSASVLHKMLRALISISTTLTKLTDLTSLCLSSLFPSFPLHYTKASTLLFLSGCNSWTKMGIEPNSKSLVTSF